MGVFARHIALLWLLLGALSLGAAGCADDPAPSSAAAKPMEPHNAITPFPGYFYTAAADITPTPLPATDPESKKKLLAVAYAFMEQAYVNYPSFDTWEHKDQIANSSYLLDTIKREWPILPEAEFHQKMFDYMDSFQDGHAQYMPPAPVYCQDLVTPTNLGIVRDGNGKPHGYISSFSKWLPSHYRNQPFYSIRLPAEIISINGVKLEPLFEKKPIGLPHPNPMPTLVHAMFDLGAFEVPKHSAFRTLELKDRDGKLNTVNIPLFYRTAYPCHMNEISGLAPDQKLDSQNHEDPPSPCPDISTETVGSVMTLTLPTFDESTCSYPQFQQTIAKATYPFILSNPPSALIIDVRGNGGGLLQRAWWAAAWLSGVPNLPMDSIYTRNTALMAGIEASLRTASGEALPQFDPLFPPYTRPFSDARDPMPFTMTRPNPLLQRPPHDGGSLGVNIYGSPFSMQASPTPIAVLADGQCASACEFFVSLMMGYGGKNIRFLGVDPATMGLGGAWYDRRRLYSLYLRYPQYFPGLSDALAQTDVFDLVFPIFAIRTKDMTTYEYRGLPLPRLDVGEAAQIKALADPTSDPWLQATAEVLKKSPQNSWKVVGSLPTFGAFRRKPRPQTPIPASNRHSVSGEP